jgi:hypothetical protein
MRSVLSVLEVIDEDDGVDKLAIEIGNSSCERQRCIVGRENQNYALAAQHAGSLSDAGT